MEKTLGMTCESFLANTLANEHLKGLEKMLNDNHQLMKETISGCALIEGEKFVTCIDKMNYMTKFLNTYATCEINGFQELDNIAKQVANQPISAMLTDLDNCEREHFMKCGYKPIPMEELNHNNN